MRVIKNKKGYTIVEVMIVMAVTGVMFAVTVLLVQGQIAKTAFRSSAHNTEQMLAGVMNDVRVGYFNSTTSPSGIYASHNVCGNSAAGKSDCEYIGKKVNIIKSNRTITTTDIVNRTTNGGPVHRADGVVVTSDLPSGLDYADDYDFEVVFTKYSSSAIDTDSITQTQGVEVSTTAIICASNGSRTVKFTVGTNGSPTVETEYQPGSCP